jgi:hypothetical protein
MIENVILECVETVYYPEETPDSATANVVPWFWSHGAIFLLVKIERVFEIYFPKEETPAFCGATGKEIVTVTDLAKIIQDKLIDTRNGVAVERPPARKRGY